MQDPVTQLYEYLDRCNREEVATYRHRGSRFNPSKIHECPRALYYRNFGTVPRSVPGFISLYGQDGDIAHDSVRWLLRKSGAVLRGLDFNEATGEIEETQFFKRTVKHKGVDVVLSGRSDGEIMVGDEWMPLEIKSIDGFSYKYILKAYQEGKLHDYLMTGAKGKYKKWYMQTTFTAKGLGGEHKNTYLLLKDRSLCQIGMYDKVNDHREGGIILPIDEELWETMLDKMVLVQKHVDSGDPVPLDLCPMEGSYECDTLCNYRHVCPNGKKGD